MKKDAYSFLHKSNFRKDLRIQRLIFDYKTKGYGMLWVCIEIMAQSDNSKVNIQKLVKELLEDDAYEFIEYCIYKLNLFTLDKNGFVTTNLVKFKRKIFSTRLFNVNVDLWYEIRKEVFERDNYTCQYCGSIGGKLEADHIIPFSKGGLDTLDNLTTACRKCNRQKKNKTIEEFKRWREEHG